MAGKISIPDVEVQLGSGVSLTIDTPGLPTDGLNVSGGVSLTFEGGGGNWPDASNTGASGTLTPFSGDKSSTGDGQVIENFDVTGGGIIISHLNVTVRNCRAAYVYVESNRTGALIEYCSLNYGALWSTAVTFDDGTHNGTVRRCNISNTEDGVKVSANNVTIEENYIHDLFWASEDPHSDGIQVFPGVTDLSVTGNNIDLLIENINSAFSGSGVIDAIFTGNRLSGGGYIVHLNGASTGCFFDANTFTNVSAFGYLTTDTPGTLENQSYINNLFGDVLYPTGFPE